MEVENRSETNCINGEAIKSVKEVSAPPSSQIPPGEDITATQSLPEPAEVKGKVEVPPSGVDKIVDPAVPVGDLNTSPSEVNLVSAEKTADAKAEETKEQEEVFDDMVIVENGMVTLPGNGSAEAQDGVTQETQKAQTNTESTCGDEVKTDEPTVVEAPVDAVMTDVPATDETVKSPEKACGEATVAPEDAVKEKTEEVITATEAVTEVEKPVEKTDECQKTEDEKQDKSSADQVPASVVTEQEPVPEVVNAPADELPEEKNDAEEKPSADQISEEEVQSIKGQKVIKKFGKKNYSGDIVSYDPETKWFKVVYEDGDEEDLELSEVKSILASLQSTPSSSKKRPHDEDGENVEKSAKKSKKSESDSTKKGSAAKSPKTPKTQAKVSKKYGSKSKSPAKKSTQSSKTAKSKGKVGTPKSSGKGSSSKKAKSPSSQKKAKAGSGTTKSPAKAEKAEETPKPESATKRKADEETTPASKTKKAKAGEATPGDNFIGKSVKKDFDGTLYSGVVIKYDKKTKYYKVKYEDGDQEELELHEIEPILVQTEENKQ